MYSLLYLVLSRILKKCLDTNADVGHGAVLTVYEVLRGVGNYARKQNEFVSTLLLYFTNKPCIICRVL